MTPTKPPWFTHLTLYRELNLGIKYTTLSPLRIGASRAKSFFSIVDLQVIRITLDGKEVPYIPGSSLKGVFRSTAEMLLRSYNKRVCSMGQCSIENIENKTRDELLQDAIKEYNRTGTNIERVISILDGYCLICKIFGSNTYASHIIFNDAYPVTDVSVGVKTGIAINRRSGAVKKGALYQVEFVNPGATFNGNIKFINLPNYVVGLILYIITKMLNHGIVNIGGFKSRGFGNIKMDIEGINGVVVQNGKIANINEVNILNGIDKDDTEVKVTRDVNELVTEFIKAWDNYVAVSS